MILSLRHFGGHGNSPSTIIELSIEGAQYTIVEDVVDFNGRVDEDLIASLRDIADSLELNNEQKQ